MPKQAPLILDATSIRALHILHDLGGSVDDPDGRVTPKLAEEYPELKRVPSHAPSQTFKFLEDHGLVSREMRGRRTYSIGLTESGWNAAYELEPLFHNGVDHEDDEIERMFTFDEVSNDSILAELAQRLKYVPEADHNECQQGLANRDAIILELNNLLDEVKNALSGLNSGEITWTSAISKMNEAVNKSVSTE